MAVGPTLNAQEHPTAQQLFKQGIKQYAEGDYVSAQQTFRRLDPLQLDKEQRLVMYETIQNIDRHLRQDTNPATLLNNAIKAQNSGKLSPAMAMYQSVIRHPRSTKKQRQKATAQLAQVKRRLNAELTRARQSIDEASADIRVGRYEAAERKLRAVKESGLDLGWFENERIDRQLMTITQHIKKQRRRLADPTGPEPVTQAPPKPTVDPQQRQQQQRQEAQRQQQQTQQKLAERKRQLAQRQQQLAEKQQAQQTQQKKERQQQAQQALAQHERQLAQRQQQLAEKQRVQQEVQRQQQAQQALAQHERQLAQRQQQLAEKQQAQRDQQEEQRQQQAQQEQQREQIKQRRAQKDRELAQREQELAQRQQQLAQKEKQRQQLARQRQQVLQKQAQQEQAQREQEEQFQRRQAQREQKLAQRERQLEELERRLEQQAQAQTPMPHTPTPQQPPQRQQQLDQNQQRLDEHQRQQDQYQQQQERYQRQKAQWQQQLAQKEQTQRQQAHQSQQAAQQIPRPTPTPTPQQPYISSGQQTPDDILAQARLLYAQEKFVEAQIAQRAQQYHLAAKLYQEVLSLDPTHPQAAAALAAVRPVADQETAPQDVLDAEIQARTIRTNATIAEFEELMSRAETLLQNQTFAAARESVQQAKITLDVNQRYLPTSRYRSLRENAVSLAARIADAERIAEESQKRELEMVRKHEAERRRTEALMAQQEETRQLIRRAAGLRREQKFDPSLELLNQALFLDPNNVAAQAMKEMIQDSQLYVEAREQSRRRNLLTAKQSNENINATVPFTDLMTYPADWPQLTATRLGGLDPISTESEVNRRVAQKLQDIVPINFEANKLVNIIEYMRNTTGANFFVNWPVLESVGVSKDTPITLQLTNVPVEQALRLVLQQTTAGNETDSIGYSVIEGVVTISTQRDLSKTTDIRPYDIRDLLVQVPNFSEAPEFDLNAALSNTSSGGSQSGGGGGGGGGGSSLFADDESEEEQPTREELIEEILTLIRDTIGTQDDWEAQGGIGSIKELNGNLIVKTTPKNHRQIALLLSQLRETRALQIAVEARFLLVDQNFLDEVGVDLDLNIDTGSSKWGPVLIGQDSIGLTGRPKTGLPGSFGDFEPTPGISIAPGSFSGLGSATSGFTPSGRSFDFGVSFLDDIQVNLMITATQANRRAITLTAPRLTLFNGQRAFVIVAKQISFISDLEPIPDGGGFDTTLSVVNSGVILDVEATVSSDRRYVTMTVRPSLATLVQNPPRKINQTATVLVGSTDAATALTINAFIEAPELELTSIKTSVSVPDRGTLLIGGQRLVADVEVEAGVPVLSKIPVLNRLFTNRSSIKDERTLLILIKPTILIQSEEEEQNFPGLLQNPQQYSVGQRF